MLSNSKFTNGLMIINGTYLMKHNVDMFCARLYLTRKHFLLLIINPNSKTEHLRLQLTLLFSGSLFV